MANAFPVTFDAHDPQGLGRFWAAVLGYVDQPPPDGHGSWGDYLTALGLPADEQDSVCSVVDPAGAGARLLFQRVPEGKTAKNRVHLDVTVGGGHGVALEERRRRVDARAAERVGLGAELVGPGEEPGGYWVVLRDPEGNEFCIQ